MNIFTTKKFHISAIIVAGIVVYSQTFHHAFHFDDYTDIVDNLLIRQLTNPAIFSTTRPFAYLTFALNYHFHALNVVGYHLTNIAIHIATALLVYWLIYLLAQTPYVLKHQRQIPITWIAFILSLLFVIHPIQTQAVTYIVQRMASLATFWFILAVCLYLKALLSAGKHRILLIIFSIAGAGCAILTKQIAATLPAILLLFDVALFKDNHTHFRRIRRSILMIIVITGAILLVRSNVFLRTVPVQQDIAEPISGTTYLFTQFRVILLYIRLLIFPIHQNLDYDIPLAHGIANFPIVLFLLVLVSLVTIGFLLYKKHRLIALGIFWFFITLSVESSVIPLANVMFEHRLYLPSIGFFIAVVFAVSEFIDNKYHRYALGTFFIIILIYGGATLKRNRVWKDELTIWTDVVKKSPGKPRPWNNRGEALRKAGKLEQAIRDYSQAIQLYPAYPTARNNRGSAYMLYKKYDLALTDFNVAIETGASQKPELFFNRGTCYYMLGNIDAAIADLSYATEAQPSYIKAWMNLGNAYVAQQHYDCARACFQNILIYQPESSNAWFGLGVTWFEQRNWQEARTHLEHAIDKNKDNANACYLLGQTLFHSGDYTNALKYFQQAQTLGVKVDPAFFKGISAKLKPNKES
ncbi:tetratricopeptide repeat protein [candidate division KSB1 bacterium]|nr:tetratricopeptide repeat protein [candidate division KSB1 bacterium]